MEWCKWIGIILMGVSVACLGFWMAYRLDKRLSEYRQLQKMLILLSGRMRLGENLTEAFDSCLAAGAGSWEPFLRGVKERLMKREVLSEVWVQELKNARSNLHLEKEDYAVLETLGNDLQGQDLATCLGRLSQIQDYFHAQQKMLEEASKEQVRLYRSIGVLGGILVVVVLA